MELEPKPSPESQGDKESLPRVTVRLSITISDTTTAKTANPGRRFLNQDDVLLLADLERTVHGLMRISGLKLPLALAIRKILQ